MGGFNTYLDRIATPKFTPKFTKVPTLPTLTGLGLKQRSAPAGVSRGWRNRVLPLEPAETGEIRVRRLKDAVVFDRQSGQMRIRDQIPHGIAAPEHLLKAGPMLVCRHQHVNAWLIQPPLYAFHRLLER